MSQFASLSSARQHILKVCKQRIDNGSFTERSLARMSGLSQPHIHHLLSGQRTGTDDALDKLAQAARVYADPDDERNHHDPEAWWAANP